MSNAPRIVLRPNPGVTTEQAYDARAHAWAFIFECWHAKKGDLHALTNDSTKNWTTGLDKKGIDNADIYGN